jgi:hypothetical protein
MIDDETIDKLAKCAYLAYAGMTNAKPEDFYSQDILPYEKLSHHSKEHWRIVAKAVALESWNLDFHEQI